MKTIAIFLTLLAGLQLTVGQNIIHNDGVVTFVNTELARPPGQPNTFHLIYSFNGVFADPLVGTQYKAELYYLDAQTSAMTPIPATISSFRASTTSSPGTWDGPAGTVALPVGVGGVDYFDDGTGEIGNGSGTGLGYYPVTLAVRIWDSTTGPTWESATVKTVTPNFIYTQRFSVPPAMTDTEMINQPGLCFSFVCPEPSAIGLSVLGIAGLLLCPDVGEQIIPAPSYPS